MKLIVGLGNPGNEYAKTRHNIGFMIVDELAKKLLQQADKAVTAEDAWAEKPKFKAEMIKIGDVILAKPTTFMNETGQSVQAISSFFNIPSDRIYIIHDDLDITLGGYKIVSGSVPKIHNGVNSVIQQMGTDQLKFVRVGVDNRTGDRSIPGKDYVLQPFSQQEREIVEKVINSICEELNRLIF